MDTKPQICMLTIRKEKIKTNISLIFAFLLISLAATSQNEVAITKSYLAQNAAKEVISTTDIDEMIVSSAYLSPSTGWYHIYFIQTYQSIEVYNGMLNATLQLGEVKNVGNTFVPNIASFIPENRTSSLRINPLEAIQAVAEAKDLTLGKPQQMNTVFLNENETGGILKATYTDNVLSNENIVVKKYWLPYESTKNGKPVAKVALTWNVKFLTKDQKKQWNIHVDAASGEILQEKDDIIRCDFGVPRQAENSNTGHENHTHLETSRLINVASDSSYHVFDYPLESPNHGSRTIVSNPYSRFVPMDTGPGVTNGWHNDGTSNYTNTRGNNVDAKDDLADDNEGTIGSSPSSATLDFNSPYTQAIGTAAGNLNAAITNLFYWNNLTHDVLWKYGFDEPSGNFQKDNLGRGGNGNDYVYADAQDGSGRDNANFSTPADGEKPRMQMFLFSSGDSSEYEPDSDFDNGVITHEYGHGWSIRLSGGPANSDCLKNEEQPGEGWSDYLALMLTTNWSSLTPTEANANISRGMGTYVIGQTAAGRGTRPFPYSYDMANVNPAVTYGKVGDANFSLPHGIGSIWATMLWDMTWEMIFKDAEIINNIYDTPANVIDMKGNIAALKLVNEGLRLQPCSPSFVQARDAILQADTLLFGARYSCVILKAFARRGLGLHASSGVSTNDRTVIEDFTPISTIPLTSSVRDTVCSNQVYSYSPTVGVSGSFTYSWNRAAVAGISNVAASGSGSISETLINTTNSPITIKYLVTVTPGDCPSPQPVNVVVKPSVIPTIVSYTMCQNGTLPNREGLQVPEVLVYIINDSIVSGSTYVRSDSSSTTYASSDRSVFYKAIPFVPTVSGEIVFEITSAIQSGSTSFLDTYLSLYQSSFDPANPSTNFLRGNDDHTGSLLSKITHSLTAGETYFLVVSTYHIGATGTFTLEANQLGFNGGVNNWYSSSSGGTILASGEIFNPVGIAGSGIPNTSTLGTTTFFVAINNYPTCRTPLTFTVSETVGPNDVSVSSSAICSGSNVTLSAICPSETINWYDQLSEGTSLGTGNNLVQRPTSNVTFYASCENATCKSVRIATSSVLVVVPSSTPLNITSDYSSGQGLEIASETITATNKITSPAKVVYKAGNSISLNQGFEAKNGSSFKAEIGSCVN